MPVPPITSVAEFARVLRDDIIPLLEEYCYDDFQTLGDILGKRIVDTDAGRIRDELFEPTREEDLIQAVSFDQLESRLLAEAAEDGGSETADNAANEHQDEDGPESAA
jgi:5-methylcytosine-specific restriction protein B